MAITGFCVRGPVEMYEWKKVRFLSCNMRAYEFMARPLLRLIVLEKKESPGDEEEEG